MFIVSDAVFVMGDKGLWQDAAPSPPAQSQAASGTGSSRGGYLKGSVGNLAWAFGAGLEKWFTESLAARVNIDGLQTSFYNSSVKIHWEYDLRATWGLIYYFGGRRRGAKIRSFAGKQIE